MSSTRRYSRAGCRTSATTSLLRWHPPVLTFRRRLASNFINGLTHLPLRW
jgi:hypothetical protein